MWRSTIAILAALLAGAASAQESPSYRLGEHVLNCGGHPHSGTILTSSGYRITLGALGAGVAGPGLTSTSHRMDGGFVPAYLPPGEVRNLRFSDEPTLYWDAERSVGIYNLYRDLLGTLSDLEYGACEQQDLDAETATDPATPSPGQGFFYLVTAENRLGEEGTKGRDGAGNERPNPNPCP